MKLKTISLVFSVSLLAFSAAISAKPITFKNIGKTPMDCVLFYADEQHIRRDENGKLMLVANKLKVPGKHCFRLPNFNKLNSLYCGVNCQHSRDETNCHLLDHKKNCVQREGEYSCYIGNEGFVTIGAPESVPNVPNIFDIPESESCTILPPAQNSQPSAPEEDLEEKK